MFLHCAGWSLEDLFGRTVTTQCHLAEQSNVWVYQVSCSTLEYVGGAWVLASGQEWRYSCTQALGTQCML